MYSEYFWVGCVAWTLITLPYTRPCSVYVFRIHKNVWRVSSCTCHYISLEYRCQLPDIMYEVHTGPARALVHIHETEHPGWYGYNDHHVIIYHGQQLGQCKMQVKKFAIAGDYLIIKPNVIFFFGGGGGNDCCFCCCCCMEHFTVTQSNFNHFIIVIAVLQILHVAKLTKMLEFL